MMFFHKLIARSLSYQHVTRVTLGLGVNSDLKDVRVLIANFAIKETFPAYCHRLHSV